MQIEHIILVVIRYFIVLFCKTDCNCLYDINKYIG